MTDLLFTEPGFQTVHILALETKGRDLSFLLGFIMYRTAGLDKDIGRDSRWGV